ncbi:MAG: pyridoxamine 5'-phosphate oxidase family protein [Flavisolibacter sp.]|nr:pyridoxamine 5'-phosphate oxidase family protein [Flavisolibacter sp.]
MSANPQLQFLQRKIEEIGSAIFFNLSDSVLKLPTSIVNTLKVDDFGYVWFFVKKPQQHVKELEPEFPARLDFFKKGVSHFLQIMGKGWVVTDPEQISTFISFTGDEIRDIPFDEYVLVKVKMLKAEYYETQSSTKTTWWQNAMNTIFTWFNNNNSYGPTTYFPASQNL